MKPIVLPPAIESALLQAIWDARSSQPSRDENHPAWEAMGLVERLITDHRVAEPVALTQEPGIPVDLSDAVAAGAEIEKLLSGYIGRDIPISVSLLKRALGIPQAQPRGPKGIPFGPHLTCSICGDKCTDHYNHHITGAIWCPGCVHNHALDWKPLEVEAPLRDAGEVAERDPWANP